MTAATPCTPSISSQTSSGVHEDVVEAVAEAADESPLDLQPPLYDAIDPDALDAVIESLSRGRDETDARVTFSYAGYEVTVAADGSISVADGRRD